MVGGDTGRHKRVKIGAFQPTRMAADQLIRMQSFLENGAHARVALDDTAHIHDFGNAADFRPEENLGKHRRIEISTRPFKPRRRRHAGRREQDGSQRQVSACPRCPGHAVQSMDIGKFMRVPDDSGHTLGDDRGSIGSRRYHGAFDMHMRIDQSRRDIASCGVQDLRGVLS